VNTAATKSAITFIDGDQGILRYRGYPIEQLAKNSTYLEVAWLLLYGELPTADELAEWDDKIRHHTLLHEDLKRFFSSLPHTAHPMSVLSAATAALDVLRGSVRPQQPRARRAQHHPPAGEAARHRGLRAQEEHRSGVPLPGQLAELRRQLPAAELRQPRRDVPGEPGDLARARASADPARGPRAERVDLDGALVGSTGANQFSSISAGINALYGPLHGGANEAVLDMLARIRTRGERAALRRAGEEQGGRVKLMGFGHRVYKNYDPRAKLVKESADEILAELGVHDPLLDLAQELEQVALEDDYFKERRLYPNVDFYTGVIYKAMGFPTRMFTPLFAIGRLPGWLAHWREMQYDPQTKIGRPQQLYVGAANATIPPSDRRTRRPCEAWRAIR
jgi:citrate synthase